MSATTIQVPEPADVAWRMSPSKASVVKAVTRRMVPYLVEATLIPTGLFYVFFITLGLVWAILAAWPARTPRWRGGSSPAARFPALLMVATLGISLRTVVYLLSTNSFVYFVPPILRTSPPGPSSPCRSSSAGRSSPGSPPISATSARTSRAGRR